MMASLGVFRQMRKGSNAQASSGEHDALAGMIAALSDPKAAVAKLEEFAKAKAEAEAATAMLKTAQVELDQRRADISVEQKALDAKLEEASAKHAALMERERMVTAAETRLKASVAAFNVKKEEFESMQRTHRQDITSARSLLQSEQQEVARMRQEAARDTEAAAAATARAEELQRQAENLKLLYEQKISKLRAYVEEGV